MKLLVLGGTHHVGRAVVETALARGDDVTTLNRGLTGHQPPGARARRADRTDPAALRAALGDESWDAVIDTWSSAPAVVGDAAALLARAGLILGPYEIVGRMPWWLRRMDRGGDVLAPGPADMPLQYVDCRDLAA